MTALELVILVLALLGISGMFYVLGRNHGRFEALVCAGVSLSGSVVVIAMVIGMSKLQTGA